MTEMKMSMVLKMNEIELHFRAYLKVCRISYALVMGTLVIDVDAGV